MRSSLSPEVVGRIKARSQLSREGGPRVAHDAVCQSSVRREQGTKSPVDNTCTVTEFRPQRQDVVAARGCLVDAADVSRGWVGLLCFDAPDCVAGDEAFATNGLEAGFGELSCEVVDAG